MSLAVVPLTVVGSLCLVFTFVLFFYCEQRRGRSGNAEHASLLPLEEEGTKAAGATAAGCGCHDGSRPPCAGCLRGILGADSPHSHRD